MSALINRRTILQSAGLAGMAAAGPRTAFGADAVGTTVVDLPFDPAKIPGLSEKLLVSHHDNNYAGAARKLDGISARLASFEITTVPGFAINGLKREQLMAANSVFLHELYFAGLSGQNVMVGDVAKILMRDFGSVEAWRNEFVAMGKAQGGGSGWVLLTYSLRAKRLINQWAGDHTNTLADGLPVLALDMYEHAYQMDYGAKAADYIDAYMKVINWANVAALHEKYTALS